MVEVLMVSSVSINASIAVQYTTFREALVVPIGSGLCVALFREMGQVHDSAREVYLALKNVEPRGALLRHEKAYRPLRIDIGRFGYADMMLCLTIMSTILGNTASLVLTTD